MDVDDKFRELALSENWISLGGWLNLLADGTEDHGFDYPQDALQAVAEIRGTKVASLRNHMSAAAWLKQNHPNVYKNKPIWLAMMQVVMLARIASYDPNEAKTIENAVLTGELSQSEIKAVLDKVRKTLNPARSVDQMRQYAKSRGQAFERSVRSFFRSHADELLNGNGLTIIDGRTLEPLATDLIVMDGESISCAVEIRGPRNRVDPGYIVDQLARAALILRRVPRLLYIVPEASEYDIDELKAARDRLEIEGLLFAALPEKENLEVSDIVISETFY